jgi:hypothetical protein
MSGKTINGGTMNKEPRLRSPESKAKAREYQRKWRAANKEKIKKYLSDYRTTEKYREYKRKHRKTATAKAARARWRHRRAIKLKAGLQMLRAQQGLFIVIDEAGSIKNY